MPLTFQSLRSGSSGNSLLLTSGGTTLLIDAGFSSMKSCRRALGQSLQGIDGALISHLHSDHLQFSSLRVLEESRVPVHVCEREIPHLAARHFRQIPFLSLKIRPFGERPFQVGDFTVRPFRVPHDGARPTYGFEILADSGGRRRKVVAATDFWHWQGLSTRFANADFIYLEANHDPALLRAHPNPRSHFHLSNESCARLLRQALDRSHRPPGAIMLGHLSEVRNRPSLARDKVLEILDGTPSRDIPLLVAPRHEPSEEIRIIG